MNNAGGNVEFDALPGEIGNVTTPPTAVGQWSHIAATYDADTETAKVYFNGVLSNQAANVDMHIDSPVNIHIASNEKNRFNGIIDDVGIFNVALDEDDINDIMTKGLVEVVGVAAVDASGKLAATWASIKTR